MSDVHDVLGYALCVDCHDALVLDVIAATTGGRCGACLAAAGEALRSIEIEARGARLPIPLKPKRRTRKPAKTPEAKARERVVDGCKTRARKRLAAIFPDIYDILLADERSQAGLDPFPIQNTNPTARSETVDFTRLYHALDERGVDV